MKPEVILVTKVYPRTQEILESEFNVHRMYEASDREALLRDTAQRVRALGGCGQAGGDQGRLR